MDSVKTIAELSKVVDGYLSKSLVEEFVSLEARFKNGDWEPAELDAGQFSEIIARIIYSVDSGVVNYTKSVDDCIRYIQNDSVTHHFSDRKALQLISKVISAVYKMRSQRGAVHIDPNHTANEFDSRMMMQNVQWLMGESVRLFAGVPSSELVRIISELSDLPHPLVFSVDNKTLVQATDLTCEEEILVLLSSAKSGLDRSDLGKQVHCSAAAVTKAIQRLLASDKRHIVRGLSDKYFITPLGEKRILAKLQNL